jgi:hypothetical protein
MEGGGVRPKDQNIYAQPHHMYNCNGGGGVKTRFIMIYPQYRK